MSSKIIERDGKQFIQARDGKLLGIRKYYGSRGGPGRNPACNCPELYSVDVFCVCTARVWCEAHGGPHCCGSHD